MLRMASMRCDTVRGMIARAIGTAIVNVGIASVNANADVVSCGTMAS